MTRMLVNMSVDDLERGSAGGEANGEGVQRGLRDRVGWRPVRPSPNDSAESLRTVLQMEGHAVEIANDGPQGLEKLREFAPDMVLCDIGLPGVDGYELAKRMREDQARSRRFLVALTGYARQPSSWTSPRRWGDPARRSQSEVPRGREAPEARDLRCRGAAA